MFTYQLPSFPYASHCLISQPDLRKEENERGRSDGAAVMDYSYRTFSDGPVKVQMGSMFMGLDTAGQLEWRRAAAATTTISTYLALHCTADGKPRCKDGANLVS